MFSSRTILALAVALNVAVSFFPTEVDSRKRKLMKKNKPKPPNPDVESFRIIALNGERIFIGVEASTLGLGPPSPPSPSLQGSQTVVNGAVYKSDEVSLGPDDEIIDFGVVPIPPPTEGAFFTVYCTVTKAISPTFIKQNVCDYNFCLPGRGCLFLRSGGDFALDVAVVDGPTPVVETAILGGTGEWAGTMGSAVLTTLSTPTDNGDKPVTGLYYAATVFQLDVSSFDLRSLLHPPLPVLIRN